MTSSDPTTSGGAWRLDQLIGRADEQRRLEQLLRKDLPARRGRTVVITGPLGSGRVALARFALWQSLHALPRSRELDTVTGRLLKPAEDRSGQGQMLSATRGVLDNLTQHLDPFFGSLLKLFTTLMPEVNQREAVQRLQGGVPSPQAMMALVEDAAGAGPFVIHIAGLDQSDLDERWIDIIATLAKHIRDQWPVLLLLSVESPCPLSELDADIASPLQRRLQKLIEADIAQVWHLGPVSRADIARYVHEPTDARVIQQLHELSGGWPLMVQALWRDWRNSAQKGTGGRRQPVLVGDGFAEPWRFTHYGLSATAHVETLLADLLQAHPAILETLETLLEDEEDAEDVLRYVLGVATLEGSNFTGLAVALACDLPWEDGLEDILDELCDAEVLTLEQDFDKLPTETGEQLLLRYRFKLPVWWHLYHTQFYQQSSDDQCTAAYNLAEALEQAYGPLAWRRVTAITTLWEQAGEARRARSGRHFLDQLAYIARLQIRARLTQQQAEQNGMWLQAHEAWYTLALAMRGYVSDEETFAAFEQARIAAEQAKSSVALAETYGMIATRTSQKPRNWNAAFLMLVE